MRYLLPISLFAVSIALGAWAYVDHKQAEQDRKVGLDVYNTSAGLTMIASLLVGMLGLGSLYGARRRRQNADRAPSETNLAPTRASARWRRRLCRSGG